MSNERERFKRIEAIFSKLSSMPQENPEAIEQELIAHTADDPSIADELRAMLDLDRSDNNPAKVNQTL